MQEGRPGDKYLGLKPYHLPGEKVNTEVLDTKHYCPFCKGRIDTNATECPNCHNQVNSNLTDTGANTPRMPEQKKPEKINPNKNIQLSNVLYDSSTGRFIVAVSEHPKEGFPEERRQRKKFFPKLKDMPRADEKLPSKEFKQVTDSNCTDEKKKVDDITKSCTDLAIDG